METIDRAEEWRRLKELYRQKSDEEIGAIAADADELTDPAWQALQAEIASRGLKLELTQATQQPEPEPEPEGDFELNPDDLDLVSGGRVYTREEAEWTRGVLRNAGLPSFLGPDRVDSVSDYTGSFEQGVVFYVRYIDSQRAFATLARAHETKPLSREEELEEQEGDNSALPRCPKCNSDEIVFLSLDGESGEETNARFHWRCDACGHQWQDDGVEQQT